MPKARTTKKTSKPSGKTTSSKSASVKTPVKTSAKSSAKKVERPIASNVSAKERAQKVTTFLSGKLRQPRVFIPVIVILVFLLLYLFRSAFIVAIVNGQPISRTEFNQQLESQAGKQVMSALVTQKLIEGEAGRRNINVSQSELDTQIKTIQDQLSKQGQTLDSALAAQGMTRSEFMTQLRLQLLVKKLLGNKIAVSDKEVNDYIDKNKDSLPTGESDSQLKTQVKQQLEQQKLSQQAQLLVQNLQSKAHVTYFTNF